MKFLIICFAVLASVNSFSQESVVVPDPYSDSLQAEEIYDIVEVSAEYPGGVEKLMKYIMTNINYPPETNGYSSQGTVYVGFVIEMNGSITNVKILKGIQADLDKEAKRVVKDMPNWKPGQNRGKVVRSRCTLPIKFRM